EIRTVPNAHPADAIWIPSSSEARGVPRQPRSGDPPNGSSPPSEGQPQPHRYRRRVVVQRRNLDAPGGEDEWRRDQQPDRASPLTPRAELIPEVLVIAVRP